MSVEFRPRAERLANPRAGRDIMCRSCARWMKFDAEFLRDPLGRWRHIDDGTIACVDPNTLRPYEDETMYKVTVRTERHPDWTTHVKAPRPGLAKTRAMFEYPHDLAGDLVEYECAPYTEMR